MIVVYVRSPRKFAGSKSVIAFVLTGRSVAPFRGGIKLVEADKWRRPVQAAIEGQHIAALIRDKAV